MRRFFTLAAVVLALGCGDSTLGPVQTADGQWSGVQNGYSLSLSLAQSANGDITGTAFIASTAVATDATVTGNFVYPNLHITITANNFLPVDYAGTMSATEAKIFGKLNGSGITNLEVDLKKK
jgi:hypothetical protein